MTPVVSSYGHVHHRLSSSAVCADSRRNSLLLAAGDALDGLSRRRRQWDDRCTAILEEFAASRSNYEMADLIAAGTGKRFSMHVVSRHRAALGLHNRGPQRNDWTSALRRWKPWQGHLARKS